MKDSSDKPSAKVASARCAMAEKGDAWIFLPDQIADRDLDAERDRVRQDAAFKVCQLERDMGNVQGLAHFLEHPDLAAYLERFPAACVTVQDWRDWLADASEDERINGRGSRFNYTHPFWVEQLAPALAAMKARINAKARRTEAVVI